MEPANKVHILKSEMFPTPNHVIAHLVPNITQHSGFSRSFSRYLGIKKIWVCLSQIFFVLVRKSRHTIDALGAIFAIFTILISQNNADIVGNVDIVDTVDIVDC